MLLKCFTGYIQRKIIRIHLIEKENFKCIWQYEQLKNKWNPSKIYNTYNTLNEVKILGHHVVEVISDEHSSNVQLNYKSRECPSYFRVFFFPSKPYPHTFLSYLNEITFFGSIFIKQSTWSRIRNKQDGFESYFPFSSEVDVCHRVIVFLWRQNAFNWHGENTSELIHFQ